MNKVLNIVLVLSLLTFGAVKAYAWVITPNKVPEYSKEFSQCLWSPETKLAAEMFQSKYHNLTISQISHIVCKDKK
jgi:hypothetical protein